MIIELGTFALLFTWTAVAVAWYRQPSRVRLREKKAIEKAERARVHTHEWTKWGDLEETRVYDSTARSPEARPIRREYRQTRECKTCGLAQRRLLDT